MIKKTSYKTILIFGLLSFLAFSWGYITNSRQIFPYNLIKKVVNENNKLNHELNTFWANKVIEGGYILHFRHAQREKWNDVTAFDAYELLLNIKAEDSSFNKAVCLTKQGIEEAKLIKNIFDILGVQTSEIISSPSCRARQTALIAFDSIHKISNSLLHRTAMTKNQHNDFAIQLRRIIDNLEIIDGKNVILSGHGGTLSYDKEIIIDINYPGNKIDNRLETGFVVLEKLNSKIIYRHQFNSIKDFANSVIEFPIN